ncbi:pentapeptide repeat-containing protein [Thaumasiovibrio subtropicus]|uniref:pentapeptide repeat-containing protein n=1 Tax=Thaumasiovibrio subtropicus TaxID=1891207 RepID=UPI000B34D2A0|nr:pentapeptide repeat-containing protein [Thaumasiovibrio subtropicus]
MANHCHYQDPDGYVCHNKCEDGSNYCYWHDPEIIKNNPDDVKKFEQYAKEGGLLRGVSMKRANLEHVNLVNYNSKHGYDLSYADFYRANLRGGHLFNVRIEHGSLMKADLSEANLHCAKLRFCNLLGVKLKGAKIDNIDVGAQLIQERKGHEESRLKHTEQALDFFEQAEEIYRDLRKAAENQGIFMMAGHCLQKELTMRRMQMPKLSLRRLTSKVVDLFCGYGENPMRVVSFSLLLIFTCAILYFFFGIQFDGNLVRFSPAASMSANGLALVECLYYSVVTFTTLGYGDFIPIGFSRLIAATEAFTGSFTIALFVVVFVKKMTR